MKKIIPLFFIFHCSLFSCFAQDRHIVDSLQNELKQFDTHKINMGNNVLTLMDTTKANILYHIGFEYWGDVYDTAFYYAEKVLSLSQEIGYKKGISNAYNLRGLIYMQMKNYPAAIDNYQKALRIRIDIGDKAGAAWTYNNMGLMYSGKGEIEKGIQCHFQALRLNEEIGNREGIATAYGKMANNYYAMGKFPEAVNNYLNALKVFEEIGNKRQAAGSYSSIGNIYFSQGNYPEALKSYQIELKTAKESRDNYPITTADYNIGRVCYKQGNDTAALRYILVSLKFLIENHSDLGYIADRYYTLGLVHLDMGNYTTALAYADSALKDSRLNYSARIYIEIGTIYEKQGRLQEALDSTSKGLFLAQQLGGRVEIKDAYNLLATIYAEMHNYKAAYEVHKEYGIILDSLSSSEVHQKIAVLELNSAFEKREDSARLELEKSNIIKTDESKRKSIITGSAIVISILTMLMAALLINKQQIKRRKDKVIFEKETRLLQVEKQRMEDELTKAEIVLGDYIKSMAEKNELLEQFKVDVENLKDLKAKEIDENRVERLEHLNKTTILTEDDWKKFKELFEQAYKGFFIRLKEKLPELTQAEIRMLCLTKLKLDTKQMGGILGVSFDTIRKSRYRLRKKLGLQEENSLDDIANSI